MSEYDDIINMPHHVSRTRPRMSLRARAGQFAPFAALTGHGAALSETARLTERPPCLTDSVLKKLDETLAYVREHAEEGVRVSVTYYVADERKEGGSYHVLQDEVKHVDASRRLLLFRGGEEVPLSSVVALEVDGGALED